MPRKTKGNASTQRLTDEWELFDISGLIKIEHSHYWKVCCLGCKSSDGLIRSSVFEKLKEWQTTNEEEYKKLLRAIQYGGSNKIHQNQNLIRQDKKKRGGYEFKNTKCKCRLFFFYCNKQKFIICTNAYWKNKNSPKETKEQDDAFALCAKIKKLYNEKESSK